MRIGTDIVEVARIEKAIANDKSGFLHRVFTENEIKDIDFPFPNYERASGFWAAKESLVKAIGYGFSQGIRFHDIEVVHDEHGKPEFILSGSVKEILNNQQIMNISLSISHCRTYAIAATIIY
ncbi:MULTISPECIES: holo-ACP synthase [Klebsiella]|uniref:holo-ACP synthase n=1 Tax=Klebsiella TaxID=570 RepID=UPI0007B39CF3|nr:MULTISPECIES: holo-ACP synthase [Klebsiella]EKZ5851484.1 holo-ACP synthase [Klebsiella aerogenes]EKZ6546753.1 holo-ACP synthase [Klebsiella aerogenes]EKZ6673195.1 holo-ACP synthase [Klebsiella aerogenes]KZR10049.1 ACP synthase [Klebsiella aerogenes]MBZ4206239.1 holo-ACP synthase [Klebsiella aerogenes]